MSVVTLLLKIRVGTRDNVFTVFQGPGGLPGERGPEGVKGKNYKHFIIHNYKTNTMNIVFNRNNYV